MMSEDKPKHQEGPQLYVIKLLADDGKTVTGYAMAEQIDFVANRDDLLGVAKEALEASEQAFARERLTLEAVALGRHKPSGAKIFAMIGSGRNSA